MRITSIITPLSTLALPALFLLGCSLMTKGAVRDAIAGAGVAPNPVAGGDLTRVPIAAARDGSTFRIITASAEEVCINGEMKGTPDDFEGARFTLKRFEAPGDDGDRVPTTESTSIKVLGTADQLTRGGVLVRTRFQTCVDNAAGILTKETRYLVIQPAPKGPFISPAIGVWHFDADVRTLGGG
jgi:hypothetical protein